MFLGKSHLLLPTSHPKKLEILSEETSIGRVFLEKVETYSKEQKYAVFGQVELALAQLT